MASNLLPENSSLVESTKLESESSVSVDAPLSGQSPVVARDLASLTEFPDLAKLLKDPIYIDLVDQILKDPAYIEAAEHLAQLYDAFCGERPFHFDLDAYSLARKKAFDNPQLVANLRRFKAAYSDVRSIPEERVTHAMGPPASKTGLVEIKTGGPNAMKRKSTDGEIFLDMIGVYFKNVKRVRTTSYQPGNENASTLHHDAVGDSEGSKSALVSSAENGIDKRGKHGRTALHNACGNGKVKKAEALILAGADVNALDNDRNTALHLAAVYGHEECVELLLHNDADITLESSFRKTPLDIAVLENHTNIVDVMKKLREKEVDAMMKMREKEVDAMMKMRDAMMKLCEKKVDVVNDE